MVVVHGDHHFYVIHHYILVDLTANVMPARDLLKHQKANLVTAIQKILRLHVMGGSDGVAGHIVTDDFCVLSLDTAPHGVADIGVALVAVGTAQLDFTAI